MPSTSSYCHLPKLTAFAGAAILSLTPSPSFANTPHALTYNFTFDPTGSVIPVAFTMFLDGELQPDGNTVVIHSITSLDFDSTVTGPLSFVPDRGSLDFLYSLVDFESGVSMPGPASTALNGDSSLQDVLACETSDCSTGQIFALGFSSMSGFEIFLSTSPVASFLEPYEPRNFRLTPHAQQVPAPLPGSGAAVAFGASRRLRSRLKATHRL
jgi:hypothetical protein